jgi:hypothetical protein
MDEWRIHPADERLEGAEGYSVVRGGKTLASGLQSKVCARMVMVELIRLEVASLQREAVNGT